MLKQLILSSLFVISAFAHQFDINVNDKDVEGKFAYSMGSMGGSLSDFSLGAHFLDAERGQKGITSSDPLFELTMLATAPANQLPANAIPGLMLGLGVKASFTSLNGHQYTAIPLGIEASVPLPIESTFPIRIGGVLYYAPSSLSLQSADGYLERRMYFDFELIENGKLELGYRASNTDLKDTNITYNDAWYFGMKLKF